MTSDANLEENENLLERVRILLEKCEATGHFPYLSRAYLEDGDWRGAFRAIHSFAYNNSEFRKSLEPDFTNLVDLNPKDFDFTHRRIRHYDWNRDKSADRKRQLRHMNPPPVFVRSKNWSEEELRAREAEENIGPLNRVRRMIEHCDRTGHFPYDGARRFIGLGQWELAFNGVYLFAIGNEEFREELEPDFSIIVRLLEKDLKYLRYDAYDWEAKSR